MPNLARPDHEAGAGPRAARDDGARELEPSPAFAARVAALFDAHFRSLYRFLDRLSGDPELAADLAQEAFVRLFRRGALPETPAAWLARVALNLLRNDRSSRARRRRLLSAARAAGAHSDPAPTPEQWTLADESRRLVRTALDRMPERERRLLLLRAEGLSYREIATALELHEGSVGTLLARARHLFREVFDDARTAS